MVVNRLMPLWFLTRHPLQSETCLIFNKKCYLYQNVFWVALAKVFIPFRIILRQTLTLLERFRHWNQCHTLLVSASLKVSQIVTFGPNWKTWFVFMLKGIDSLSVIFTKHLTHDIKFWWKEVLYLTHACILKIKSVCNYFKPSRTSFCGNALWLDSER